MRARPPPDKRPVVSSTLLSMFRVVGGTMPSTFALLNTPITATVIKSFGSFKEHEQVVINRITNSALMFGVAGRREFVPQTHVDKESREKILGQRKEKYRVGSRSS